MVRLIQVALVDINNYELVFINQCVINCGVRTYGQYCAIARALDVVGDRWAALIIRELLIRGPSRYTDLKNDLPGIATNLLGGRLKELVSAGIIRREETPPPTTATLYSLTDRGRAFEPVLRALTEWGEPLLARPVKTDAFRTHWLALPATIHLKDHTPWSRPTTIEVRTGEEPMLIRAEGGKVEILRGSAAHPDAVITASPALIVQVIIGGMTLTDAAAWGLEFEGDPSAFMRVQPKAGRADAIQRPLFPDR